MAAWLACRRVLWAKARLRERGIERERNNRFKILHAQNGQTSVQASRLIYSEKLLHSASEN